MTISSEIVEVHPCGHVVAVAGCGGCNPGAVELVRGDGSSTWRSPIPSDFAPETLPPGQSVGPACTRCQQPPSGHDFGIFCR